MQKLLQWQIVRALSHIDKLRESIYSANGQSTSKKLE